jgi:Xaa-Pro aminopeptidase
MEKIPSLRGMRDTLAQPSNSEAFAMKTVASLAILVLAPALLSAQSPVYYQPHFPPEEFKARWDKIFTRIGPKAAAIVQGMPKVNGFIFPRQNNEFYYLSGIETPHAYLILDGKNRKVTLYLPPRDVNLERAEGRVLSADDAELVKKLVGVDDVLNSNAMREHQLPQLKDAQTIYTLFSPGEGNAQSRVELRIANRGMKADYWDGRESREENFASLLKKRFPDAPVKDLTPILDSMRAIKSPREITLIRRASQIAGLGLIEAMKSTKPGGFEYQLDAAARYAFLVNGARLEGYRSITAAGTANIWNMHYYRNNSELKSGDLVLMDYAPDYGYYVSDIARMWPVNGKFSPEQRELLQFVLEYRNAIIKRIRPRVESRQIMEEAKKAMEPIFQKTKFSKPAYEKAARTLVERGGGVFSHMVGMAVHDDGTYATDLLLPGQVFSIDPQLRVPQENLYIRYEDVVAVTNAGVENFTDFLPSELADIERLVGQGGVVQSYPPVPEEALTRKK